MSDTEALDILLSYIERLEDNYIQILSECSNEAYPLYSGGLSAIGDILDFAEKDLGLLIKPNLLDFSSEI